MADKITYELIIDSGTPISVGTACSYNVTKLDNGPHTAKVIGTCQHGNKYESDEKDFTLAHPIPQISYKLNNTDAYTKNTDIWYYSDSFSWSVTNNLECTYNLYYNDELLLENTTETSFNIVEYLNEYIAQDILNITHRYNLANFAIEAISTKYGTKYRRNVYLYDYIFNNICLRFSDGIDPTTITPSSLAGLQYYSWIKLEDSEYNDWMFKVSSSKGLSYIFDDTLTTDVDNNIQILSNDIKYYEINNNTSSPKTQLYASFRNCTGITKVENIDIEYCNYFSETFSKCSNVTDITIDNTSDLMSMYGTFFDCKKLVNISDIVTDNILNIFNTFRQCTSLITAPNITSPGIKAITSCFLGDTKLETIPQYNYTGLTDASNSFNSCIALTSYGEIDLSLATDVNGLFNNCQKLTEIKIKNNDVSNVTNAAAMCCDCFEITEIPALIFSTKLNYGRKMFYECRNAGSGADVLYKSIKDFPSMVNEDTNANYNMFTLVGVDVDGGTEQLYEIPTYWGGVTPPAITATATVNDNTATISYSFNKNTFDTWTIVCEDQTKTDKSGTFTFTDLSNGEYTYTITATCKHGYETSTDVSFTIDVESADVTLKFRFSNAATDPTSVEYDNSTWSKVSDSSYNDWDLAVSSGVQSHDVEYNTIYANLNNNTDTFVSRISDNVVEVKAYPTSNIYEYIYQLTDNIIAAGIIADTSVGVVTTDDNNNHVLTLTLGELITTPTIDLTSLNDIDQDIEILDGKINTNIIFSDITTYKSFTSLTKIVKLDASAIADMKYKFAGCSNLKSVQSLNMSNATDATQMFIECRALTSVNLTTTNKLINTSQMFQNCTSLIDIPLFDTSNVTDMSAMCYNCQKLTTIPQFNTSNSINMEYMFADCTSLTTVPLFNMSNADKTDYMFSYCTALKSIPLFNISNVTNLSSMFADCTSITSIPTFSLVKATAVSSMFAGCKNVKNGLLTFYNMASVISGIYFEHCFENCGTETEEGMAERAQIPTTWGGDLEVA